MFEIIRKLFKLLNRRERRNAVIIFIMILFNGVMEAVGVASIMPFLSVLSNPEVIKEEIYLSFTYEYLNFSSINDFLIFLGTAVFFLVVFGLGLKSLTIYCIARFSHMQNYSLSTKLLRSYLSRPYSWFLNRNSADLGNVFRPIQAIWGILVLCFRLLYFEAFSAADLHILL